MAMKRSNRCNHQHGYLRSFGSEQTAPAKRLARTAHDRSQTVSLGHPREAPGRNAKTINAREPAIVSQANQSPNLE